jgi:hypothetical protein
LQGVFIHRNRSYILVLNKKYCLSYGHIGCLL